MHVFLRSHANSQGHWYGRTQKQMSTHTHTDPRARMCTDVCSTHWVRMSRQTRLQTQMRAGEDASTSGGVYLQKQKEGKKRTTVISMQSGRRELRRVWVPPQLCSTLVQLVEDFNNQARSRSFSSRRYLNWQQQSYVHEKTATHRHTVRKPESKKRQRRGRVARRWKNYFAFTFSQWRRHREDPTVDDLQTDYCLSYTD